MIEKRVGVVGEIEEPSESQSPTLHVDLVQNAWQLSSDYLQSSQPYTTAICFEEFKPHCEIQLTKQKHKKKC
jgi:hypothetical protein